MKIRRATLPLWVALVFALSLAAGCVNLRPSDHSFDFHFQQSGPK